MIQFTWVQGAQWQAVISRAAWDRREPDLVAVVPAVPVMVGAPAAEETGSRSRRKTRV